MIPRHVEQQGAVEQVTDLIYLLCHACGDARPNLDNLVKLLFHAVIQILCGLVTQSFIDLCHSQELQTDLTSMMEWKVLMSAQ